MFNDGPLYWDVSRVTTMEEMFSCDEEVRTHLPGMPRPAGGFRRTTASLAPRATDPSIQPASRALGRLESDEHAIHVLHKWRWRKVILQPAARLLERLEGRRHVRHVQGALLGPRLRQ